MLNKLLWYLQCASLQILHRRWHSRRQPPLQSWWRQWMPLTVEEDGEAPASCLGFYRRVNLNINMHPSHVLFPPVALNQLKYTNVTVAVHSCISVCRSTFQIQLVETSLAVEPFTQTHPQNSSLFSLQWNTASIRLHITPLLWSRPTTEEGGSVKWHHRMSSLRNSFYNQIWVQIERLKLLWRFKSGRGCSWTLLNSFSWVKVQTNLLCTLCRNSEVPPPLFFMLPILWLAAPHTQKVGGPSVLTPRAVSLRSPF